MDQDNSFGHLPDAGNASDNAQSPLQQSDNSFAHLSDASIPDPSTWHRSKEELDALANQGHNQSWSEYLNPLNILNPQSESHRAQMAAQYRNRYGADWYDRFNNDIKEQDLGAASLRQGIEGVPILGAAIEKTPVMEKLEQEEPIMSRARKIVGGAGAMIPAVAAAPEVFGAGAGQNLLARMGMGALSNSAISGADTALRGGTTKDVENSMINSGFLGVGLPVAASGAARAYTLGRNAMNYGNRVVKDFRNPQLASDRSLVSKLDKAKVTPDQLRESVFPISNSDLQNQDIDTSQIYDIIDRGLSGETADSIAQYYNIDPSTVMGYIDFYKANNQTPMNIMDLTSEIGGVGRSIPLTREARAALITSQDAESAQRLFQRQMDQPARVTGIVNTVLPNPSTAEEINAAQRAAQQHAVDVIDREYPGQNYERTRDTLANKAQKEARQSYKSLHAQPDVSVDDGLARIMSSRLASSAYDQAVESSAIAGDPIPTREELVKMYGINPKPGLGLNEEGQQVPPMKYPVPEGDSHGIYPGAVIPVKALDYFQRVLRRRADAGFRSGDPSAQDYNTLRQRFIDYLDPRNPSPESPTLVPGFRDTMGSYRTGMAHQEALDAASGLKPVLNENTYNTLTEFDNMTPSQQELFRLRYARNMQDSIQNKRYGAQALEQFDTPAAQQITRRIFGKDVADRIVNGLEDAKLTANAMSMGEDLATKLSSEDSRVALNQFNQMTPVQQDLFRRGLSTRLRSLINAKNDGQDVTSQFNNANTRELISQILPKDEANILIRGLNRENITTQTKNAISGNSNTAQTEFDVNDFMNDVRAASNLATGRIHKFMDNMAERLARFVGEQKARYTIRTLTETDPSTMLKNIERLATVAKSEGERDIYEQMLREIPNNVVRNSPYAIAPYNTYLNQHRSEHPSISRARTIIGQSP